MRIIRSVVVAAYVVVFLALPVHAGASTLGGGPFDALGAASMLVWLFVPALGGASTVAVVDRRRRRVLVEA